MSKQSFLQKALAKAPVTLNTPVQESIFDAGVGGVDPDVNLSASQGGSPYYRKLSKIPTRDLSPITQARMLEIASWLYDSNPGAKRILELTRDYILGEGAEVHAQDEDDDSRLAIQNIIDRFWNDPFNQMDLSMYQKVLELGMFGEQIYPVDVNAVDGSVRLGYVDPSVVNKVYLDKMNVGVPIDIETGNGLSQMVAMGETDRLRVVHLEDNPDDPWYGRLKAIGNNEAITEQDKEYLVVDASTKVLTTTRKAYLGSCLIFQINKPTNAERGRSDLLPLADLIDAYDQILFSEVDRNMLLRNFIWDVTMTGSTQADMDKFAAQNAAPRPGTVRVHNEKVAWQAITPDLKANDLTADSDLILSYIATGSGHPKVWLNGLMDVNKSSAGEMGDPAFKRLTARQKYVKYIITHIINFVLDQAEMIGLLPKRANIKNSLLPTPWSFTIHLPEIRARDLATNASAVLSTMQALSLAREDLAIDVVLEQEVLAMLLGQLGVDVDLLTLRKRLETADLPPSLKLQMDSANATSKIKDLSTSVKKSPGNLAGKAGKVKT